MPPRLAANPARRVHPADGPAEDVQVPRLDGDDLAVLDRVQQRVLWLAAAIVHHANRVRPNRSGVKVGGHQASSASMVSLMTALWFAFLRAPDRVSVKPHASPVLHAINHLLGRLDRKYLTTLRSYGGLQSYPSRIKDPDPVVNEMAEHALWSIWFRSGSEKANCELAKGARAMDAKEFEVAVKHFTRAIRVDPKFSEAYNQRALARYMLERYEEDVGGNLQPRADGPSLSQGAAFGAFTQPLPSGPAAKSISPWKGARSFVGRRASRFTLAGSHFSPGIERDSTDIWFKPARSAISGCRTSPRFLS